MSTKKVILTKENQDFGFAIHHFTTETLLKQIVTFLFIIFLEAGPRETPRTPVTSSYYILRPIESQSLRKETKGVQFEPFSREVFKTLKTFVIIDSFGDLLRHVYFS